MWLLLIPTLALAATFNDSFTRADSNNDLGANWTDAISVGLGINSNRAYSATPGASRASWVTGTTQTAAQYIQGTINDVGSSRYFTFMLRGSGADGTRAAYEVSVGGTNELYIEEVAAGTGTNLATGSFTLANGDVVRAEAEGTALRLKINGTTRLSTTDGTLTSGLTGLSIYHDSGLPTIDNVEAGDIGGGGGGTGIILKRRKH